MESARKYSLEELQDIAARQVKVYGDALDRIATEVSLGRMRSGELVTFIQSLKINYGLGKPTKRDLPFEIKTQLYDNDLEDAIVNYLERIHGQKVKARDIFTHIDGRMSQASWLKARTNLLTTNRIKMRDGRGTSQLYWID